MTAEPGIVGLSQQIGNSDLLPAGGALPPGRSRPAVSGLYASRSDSIRTVMQRITDAAAQGLPGGIALIVNGDDVLEGVLTDGDIRRALLAGHLLDDHVSEVMIHDPIVFDSSLSYRQILEQIPIHLALKGRYQGGVLEKVILVDADGRVDAVLDFMELWRNQNMRHRQVAVIGMGYVGLTLAATLADVGCQVTGVEQDEGVREALQAGRPHFHEVGLEPLIRHHLGSTLNLGATLPRDAEVYVIAVGTPVSPDGAPDMSHIENAAHLLGEVLSYGNLVVLRSTVPVGTCRGIVLPILERSSRLKCGRDFYLAFAPERTIEGKALAELRSLPQVIGGFDQNSVDLTANLFRELTPSIITVNTLEEAEVVKLINNSFRDLSFSFSNELTRVCEAHNLDAAGVVRVANEGYPRNQIPVPSPGVGGTCLKKDPHMYAYVAEQAGVKSPLSRMGRAINEAMPGTVVESVLAALRRMGKDPAACRFFLVGLAFKGEPETSDLRHSTSLDVLELLRPHAGEIRGYDPVIDPIALAAIGLTPVELRDGFKGADAVLILNNHRSYADLDIFDLLQRMNRPAVYFDGWRIFGPEEIQHVEGIGYVGLGFSLPPA